MKNLITEIERVREIMGLHNNSKPLITENIGVLYKLLMNADTAFKNVDDTKKFLNDLNNSIPPGVKKLTVKEIDDLSELLSRQADDIKNAVKGVDISGAAHIESVDKLKKLIAATKRTQSDALFVNYLGQTLNKVYNDPSSNWNKFYFDILEENEDAVRLLLSGKDDILEDDIIKEIKKDLYNRIRTRIKDFDWKEYPYYEKWIQERLLKEGGDLDELMSKMSIGQKNINSQIIPSKNRFDTFKKTQGGDFTTNLSDIKGPMLINIKFWNSLFTKFGDLQGIKVAERLEKNMTLFEGFEPAKVFIEKAGGTRNEPILVINEQFKYLVQNISKDFEQVATYEKNLLTLWNELISKAKEIDPSGEMEKWLLQTPIYEKRLWGIAWKQETVDELITRLKKIYIDKPGGNVSFPEKILLEIKETLGIVSGLKQIMFGEGTFWSKILEITKSVVGRRLFSAAIWGLPFTPKQLGLLLSRGGFGTKGIKFFVEKIVGYCVSWFILVFWKKVGIVLATFIFEFGIAIGEKIYPGISDAAPGVSVWDIVTEKFNEEFSSFMEVFDWPFEVGPLTKYFVDKFWPQTIAVVTEDQNQVINNFESVKQEKFIEMWETLEKEGKSEKILDKFEKSTETPFARISSYLEKYNAFWRAFVREEGIEENDIQKLLNARIATVSVNNFFDMGTDLKKLLEKQKNTESLGKVEKYLDVGGFRDKNDNIYTVSYASKDDLYRFLFTGEKYNYFAPFQLEDKSYAVFFDDGKTNSKPVMLDAESLEKYGITPENKYGTFSKKEEAEAVVKQLKETHGKQKTKPITTKEFVKLL